MRLFSLLPASRFAAKFFLILCGFLCAPAAIAQVQYSVLYNFPDPGAPGPSTALIQAADGNFYGTTGVEVFKATSAGSASIFYTFCALTNCPDGNTPQQNLIQGLDGSFYGVNQAGGADGGGTIFKLTQQGVFSVLHTFCGQTNCTDGTQPEGGVIQDAQGNFYGTTYKGGAHDDGVLYELNNSGSFIVLHSFCAQTSCTDGENPTGNLVQGSDGNFYGTTQDGGNQAAGTVFQWTSAAQFNVLYSFCVNEECSDGAGPVYGLAEGANGNFYGVTSASGDLDSNVYYVTPTGTEQVVFYIYPSGTALFTAPPVSPLIWGSDGNYYGLAAEAAYGEANLQPDTALYIFCSQNNCADGEDPVGGMIQASNGGFYGTTYSGGADGGGVIYEITNGTLAGPVQLNLSSQSVTPNQSVTLTWAVNNAFSATMRQCVASVASGGGSWSGLQSGAVTGTSFGASTTITPTAIGTYTYALTCGGVESGFATLAVTADGKAASSASVTASPNPATIGNPVTLTATVTPSIGKIVPTGSVEFKYGNTILGSAQLNNSGVASIAHATAGLPAGTYPVTTTYSGDLNYDGSTSPVANVTLQAATVATTTQVSVTPNPVYMGQSATLTATVTANGSTPTGTVSFYAQATLLGSATLSAGVAQFSHSTAGLAAGAYKVTAAYQASSPWEGSASSPVSVTVAPNPTAVSLSAMPNPVLQGNEVTLTAQVTRVSNTGTPTGTVKFSSRGEALGSAAVNSNGVAAIIASTVGIATGTYPVIATYDGDASDAGSVSSPVSVTVQAP